MRRLQVLSHHIQFRKGVIEELGETTEPLTPPPQSPSPQSHVSWLQAPATTTEMEIAWYGGGEVARCQHWALLLRTYDSICPRTGLALGHPPQMAMYNSRVCDAVSALLLSLQLAD